MSFQHQAVLPLPRPGLPRVRACRRPFVPSPPVGPYRLPRAVLDRLTVTLAPFRNRDAALALAVFLARYHSAPRKLGLPFPIDRRAIAERSALDLTEARVRGAIATLEAVGFLNRADDRRLYRATADGLHRRPILYTFGFEALKGFKAANQRAVGSSGKATGGRRPLAGTSTPLSVPRPSSRHQTALNDRSPKSIPLPVKGVLMGDQKEGSAGQRPAPPIEPGSALSDALARLARGVLGAS